MSQKTTFILDDIALLDNFIKIYAYLLEILQFDKRSTLAWGMLNNDLFLRHFRAKRHRHFRRCVTWVKVNMPI